MFTMTLINFRLDIDNDGNPLNVPNRVFNKTLVIQTIHPYDGQIGDIRGQYHKYVTPIPFPSVIKINDRPSNIERAIVIRKRIQEGYPAVAFLQTSKYNDQCARLVLKFGKK